MKHILMTGGTGNLGKTVVDTLSAQYNHLHLAVRNNTFANAERLSYYAADLSNEAESESFVKAALASSKNLHAGVFLAGGYAPGRLGKATMGDISHMISLNFETAFHTAKKLVTHYKSTGGGKLIFMGSKAAMQPKLAVNNLAYGLSKQMLFNFVALINEEAGASGTSAHILLPETIDTPLNREIMPDADFSQWTSMALITETIAAIIEGREQEKVIAF